MNGKKVALIFILFSLTILSSCGNLKNKPYEWTEYELIAHALGVIDDETYTNSIEAFEESYNNGHRLFEVDISITSDNKLVARHGWEDDLGQGITKAVNYKEFMNTLYHDKYNPVDFETVLNLLDEYPDIYMVLDGKVESPKDVEVLYEAIGEEIEGINKNIQHRLIPQMFYEEDLEVIRSYGFHDLVYVVGREEYTAESIAEFGEENDVRVVSLSRKRITPELVERLKESGILVYMYTLNDEDEMREYLDIGVQGFFTDFVISFDDIE